jgi:hypothetical protein
VIVCAHALQMLHQVQPLPRALVQRHGPRVEPNHHVDGLRDQPQDRLGLVIAPVGDDHIAVLQG